MNRRQFIQTGLSAMGSLVLPSLTPAVAHAATDELGFSLKARHLNLFRPKTGEHLNIEYIREGQWREQAYPQICWLMRDVRARKQNVVAMDTSLIATLDWTQTHLKSHGYTDPIHILSGYRSPSTNANTEGAAKNSLHMQGKAVDIHIPGVSPEYLGALISTVAKGGVGVYENKGFVHIDSGTVRLWRG